MMTTDAIENGPEETVTVPLSDYMQLISDSVELNEYKKLAQSIPVEELKQMLDAIGDGQ